MNIDQMTEKLRTVLIPERFEHSLCVMESAVRLAKVYGADVEKARIAGLLHDCAKNYSTDELYSICDKYGVVLDSVTKNEVGLLHPIAGACILKDEYGIDDDEIYDAVFYHTVGKPDMPILTKIIFIADCIEPSRTSRWVDDVRAVVYKDIDAALIIQLDNTIKCVLKKGTLLHTNTINTRNFYVERARCQNVKKN